MKHISHAHRRQQGLTLLEILVALTMGLVVIGGTIQIYLSSSQSYRTQEALSRIQENGRFAMEILNREIRMAGFSGCPPDNDIANVLNDPGTRWWSDFPTLALRGYAGTEAFPAQGFGTGSGDRVNDTEALIVIGGGGQGYSISDTPGHNPQSAVIHLNQLHNLLNGDIVMVCDAQQTAIMQVTNVNENNVTIVHNTGTGTPGNCNTSLGSPDPATLPDPTNVVLCDDAVPYQFRSDATMVNFNPLAFYIGVSTRGDSRSLYRIRIRSTGGGNPSINTVRDELIEHVEDMRILYGIDTTNNRQIDDYVDVADVANWDRVLGVRLDLLLASAPTPRVIQEAQTVLFPTEAIVGGDLVSGVPRTDNDGRLRHVFSATIGVRNRLP